MTTGKVIYMNSDGYRSASVPARFSAREVEDVINQDPLVAIGNGAVCIDLQLELAVCSNGIFSA